MKTNQNNIEKYESNVMLDIERINQLSIIVDNLKDSALAQAFVTKTAQKDEDGNLTGVTLESFNKADMILCLQLGYELGIPPMQSLALGRTLNLDAVKKIERGKSLGLDYMTSLKNIYVWGSGDKEIIYTSINIVNSSLTRAGVTKRIIEDGKTPIYKCQLIDTDRVVEYDDIKHYDVTKLVTEVSDDTELKSELDKIRKNGFKPCVVLEESKFYRAKVELTRKNIQSGAVETIAIPYSTTEAIDAGLLKGVDSSGKEVKGKDNWNAHPATHLIKMSIMIGGRIIASDVLMGVYLPMEISTTSKDIDNIEDIEEAEIVS